jgi:hypothetical protein
VPGKVGENTPCDQCGALLIERHGFVVRENRIRQGACPDLGTRVEGIGMNESRAQLVSARDGPSLESWNTGRPP